MTLTTNHILKHITTFCFLLTVNILTAQFNSIRLDRTNQNYISLDNSSGSFYETGDFTFEMWIKINEWDPNGVIGFKAGILSYNQQNFWLSITAAGKPQFRMGCGDLAFSYTASDWVGNWKHIAMVRTGETLNWFVDGVLRASRSCSGGKFMDATQIKIGYNPGWTAFLDGHISKIRYVKGSAIYTSNFTPEMQLENISGTHLLLNVNDEANAFTDSSNNNHTVTLHGSSDPFFVQSNGPNSPPTDIQLSNTNLAENSTIGTIVGNLSAIDTEGTSFTYNLASGNGSNDAQNNLFVIENSSLKTNALLDFETTPTANIYINVNDGSNDFQKAFVINLSDFTADYSDISNTPTLFDGTYASLSGTPTLPTNVSDLANDAGYSTFDGDYTNLTNKPTFRDIVATNPVFLGDMISAFGTEDVTNRSTLDIIANPDGDLITGFKNNGSADRFNISLDNTNENAIIGSGGGYGLNLFSESGNMIFEGSDAMDTPSFDFNGTITTTETVIATAFIGDGAQLTNLPEGFDGEYANLTNSPLAFNASGTGGIQSTGTGGITASGNLASGTLATALGNQTRATSAGALAIGQWNTFEDTIDGAAADASHQAFVIGNGSGSGRSNAFEVLYDGTTTIAGDVVINSDMRLKANIISLGSTLSKLLQIDGKTYTMKEDKNQKQKIGVLAQDIEKVFPELVSETKGIKSVNYQGLVPVLINSIKEQEEKIERLEMLVKKLLEVKE